MSKVLEIKTCGQCPWYLKHTHIDRTVTHRCLGREVNRVIADPHGSPFPEWCPLADVPEGFEFARVDTEMGEFSHMEMNSRVYGVIHPETLNTGSENRKRGD